MPQATPPALGADRWSDLDFRVTPTSDNGMSFYGYAAVFDSESEDLGGFRETIAPGAFTKSLGQRSDIKMFLNHNWDILLASRKAGSMNLTEDEYGLHAEADLPDTSAGRDAAYLLKRGDIHTMSFGFAPIRTDKVAQGQERLVEVKLYEVSPVTAWPAYRATSAAVRALAGLANVEDEEMADALTVLTATEGQLTDSQRDFLMRAIHARTPTRYVPATLAERQARLAALIERTETA